MIAPTAFGFNDQTAQDNSFMHASREGGSTEAGSDVTQHVLQEFSGLYRELTEVRLFRPCPRYCTLLPVLPTKIVVLDHTCKAVYAILLHLVMASPVCTVSGVIQ